jgi:hypothetical protein
MRMTRRENDSPDRGGSATWRGWLGLGIGLAAIWLITFVILPGIQRLPLIKPVMEIIAESGVNAGSYWYTQLEETADGSMYVRNTLDGITRRQQITNQKNH